MHSVRVPTRQNSTKIQLKGIFVGAKVVRGPDWEWGQQDGGDGKTGRVMEIRGWDNESCRSVANVSWVTGSTNVYRLGHKGNVDLKYLQPAAGGYYYRDHMPILGKLFFFKFKLFLIFCFGVGFSTRDLLITESSFSFNLVQSCYRSSLIGLR